MTSAQLTPRRFRHELARMLVRIARLAMNAAERLAPWLNDSSA